MRGPAEHIVSELHFDLSVPAMVALIKRQFGRADQQERYRPELQRLRQGNLTLEQLHHQVRELAHRAYPTAPASVVDVIARDAYVLALDNAEMRLRIRTAVPVPETLEDVVRVAGQQEVWLAPAARDDSQRRPDRVRQVVADEARDADPRAHPRRRSRGRSPCRSPHKDPVLEAVKQQLSQLKTELESHFQALEGQNKGQPSTGAVSNNAPNPSDRLAGNTGQSSTAANSGANAGQGARRKTGRCGNCREEGHWWKECTHPRRRTFPPPKRADGPPIDNRCGGTSSGEGTPAMEPGRSPCKRGHCDSCESQR